MTHDTLGRLLVVDDEEMNRDMLGRRLELEGYSVDLAEDGEVALSRISETAYDAVLLDAMMPGMSGYDVLRAVRQSQSALQLPVLMVTARSQSEDVVQAFEAGANDYITKPINFPVALVRVQCQVASHRMMAQLRESEERYSLSAQGANDGLWDWDLVRDRVHYSARWKTMLGYAESDIGDSPADWLTRVHADDLRHVRQAMADHLACKSLQFESEHRMLHRDQSYRWVLTRGMATRGADGRPTRMAGSQTDITRGKAADPLTGLANRVLYLDHLQTALQQLGQPGGKPFAVMYLDLDRFKGINDSLGHHVGDQLLVHVARRLEQCLRSSAVRECAGERCTVSRFGGDEFVLLIRELISPSAAEFVAGELLRTLSAPLTLDGHEIAPSTSIGIAVGQDGSQTAEELLLDADTAMYQAKSQGKSRWCVFQSEMRARAIERHALEQDLRKALKRGELRLNYQPIVTMPLQRIAGMEALLRWQHPVRGVVSPAEFIPVAEETGVIYEIGEWVLREACQQLQHWQSTYPELEHLYVSVNVSSKQFADANFVNLVRATLQQSGLSGENLKLEVTESAIMADPRVAAIRLEEIRALGVNISLDDFGTGYSSLSYLQSFKIDTLKIDRSFVARMGESQESEEIVRTIINLAHNLGMAVTAEGIEDDEQHALLNKLDCESGQGYLYSRPVDGNSLEELLRQEAAATGSDPLGTLEMIEELLAAEARCS